MQEPQASLVPNAYDDNTTLFGAMVNHKTFTVKYQVNVDGLDLVVNEDASMMSAPLYLTFEGGEIWFVGTGGIAQNTESEWVFSLETHIDQRAMHGSPLQPHVVGEKVYVGLLSQNVIMAKRVLQAAQRYRFRVGTDAVRIAIVPEVGERFLCSDTKRIHYCLTVGVWTWMNRTHHDDLDGLGDNDHPQYARLADLDGWHGATGHIVEGDDHDHTSDNEGAAITRLRNTTFAALGTPVTPGDVCFVTDVDGGTVYVSFDGSTWEKLSGIPSGAIAMFPGACPSGWTRYTTIDGRFPMGSATWGATGGNTTHTHTYGDIPAHTHSIPQTGVTSGSKGSHTHNITAKSTGGGSSGAMAKYGGNDTWDTESGGAHSHTVSAAARTTNSTGGSAATNSTSSLPPYQEVVFCRKV